MYSAGVVRPSVLGGKGFPSQKPSLSVLTKVPPMICIRVLPDSCWISGEPSGQKSNVFGPLEMVAEEICLAMPSCFLLVETASIVVRDC